MSPGSNSTVCGSSCSLKIKFFLNFRKKGKKKKWVVPKSDGGPIWVEIRILACFDDLNSLFKFELDENKKTTVKCLRWNDPYTSR